MACPAQAFYSNYRYPTWPLSPVPHLQHYYSVHDQADIHRSYVSPRKRAQRTFELLNLGLSRPLPWTPHGDTPDGTGLQCEAEVEVTDYIREWDYGDYEGITSPEIRKIRAEQGIKGSWDIWKDGCPGGE